MKKCMFIGFMLALLLPALTIAQGVVSGAFTGLVTDNDGTALPGVEIRAVHIPTGTVFSTVTRSDGRFFIPSVRVGGPYEITATLEGFQVEKQANIRIKLGETKDLAFSMKLETIDAGEIIVTASDPIINPSRTGASQNVTEELIESLPTISRQISDFTRVAPQFTSADEVDGAFNAAGRSSRYNNIQIDGAQNNDLFGLGDTGAPGGQALTTPISLDAIQEFQIVLAPYDVRQGVFTGGGVNVITKSGTNEFHGSGYWYGRNENLVGNGPDDQEFAEFTEKIMGATFGGPIVKDKLFFFASFETTKKTVPENYFISGTGSASDFGYKAEADRFTSILQSKYGYDPGTYGEIANEQKSDKLFLRLDWNINRKHRLSLRHNLVDATREVLYRSSPYSLTFGNGGYDFTSKTNSTVLQLHSTFSQNLFNEMILNFTTIRDTRHGMGADFPRINVDVGNVSFTAGTEEYSTANQLDQDLFEITDNLTLSSGNHTFVFGTHNEFFKFYNVFVQRSFGVYDFDSLDDLEAGTPSYYDRYYSTTNDPNAPAEFSVFQLGLYAMDTWNVMPNLNLTIGLRADVPLMPDTPPANPAVEAAFGIPTDQNAGGNLLWSPRLGFNWDIFSDQRTQLRGGIGIFSGRTPYVWISNQYSNTGTELARYRNYAPDFFITDPYNQPTSASARIASDINLISDDYRFPQLWRFNLAVDQKLPMGFTGTVEFVYSKSINEILYQNVNIAPNGEYAFDGRPLYGTPSTASYIYGRPDYVDPDFGNVILLTNTDKGYQYALSFQIQKEWGGGNNFNAAYTYGMAKDLFGGTSSRAISNWQYNIHTGDPNNPELSYSAHDTRHRFLMSVTKRFNLIPKAPTTATIFYTGRSGKPYSTRYYNDFNGDGTSNDSIYVPQSENELILLKGTWEELDAYIKADPGLDSHRGQILPRNASRDPWYHRLDLKFAQDIPLPALKNAKVQLTLDITNLLNMFNKEWGVYKYVQYDDAPLTYRGMDADTGLPMFEFWGKTASDDARYTLNQILSRWQMILGVRVKF